MRPAQDADSQAIRRIVRQARIFPLNLDWRRFLVAEKEGNVIGTGQVKPHRDGTRELASIAVVPEWQRQGIASRLIMHLLAGEPGFVYLICQSGLAEFYERFGFHIALPEDQPPTLGRAQRLGNVFFDLGEKFGGEKMRLVVMERTPRGPHA